jgi:hypothetical protein
MKTGIAKHYDGIDYRDSTVLPTTPINPDHALRCARRLYRWGLGEFPAAARITTGNRYTWVRHGVLLVNAQAGWKRLAHDLSHLLWSRANPGERPHSKAHARFEAKLVREILKRDYLTVTTPPLVEMDVVDEGEAKASARAERIERLMKREALWERKLDRATKAIAKIRRSLRAYERADRKRAA